MTELSDSFEPHMTLKGIELCTVMLDLNSFPYANTALCVSVEIYYNSWTYLAFWNSSAIEIVVSS